MPKEIDELWKKGMKIIEDSGGEIVEINLPNTKYCLLYTSPSPRD